MAADDPAAGPCRTSRCAARADGRVELVHLGGDLHYSGILVVAQRNRLPECAREIDALEGAEVHHRDPSSGRLVVVVESATAEGGQELLLSIRALPGVIDARLVYHVKSRDLRASTVGVDAV